MNGINLPKVIFGTSSLGNLYVALSDADKYAIVKACVQHSAMPVVFDTAGKYGAGLALDYYNYKPVLGDNKAQRDLLQWRERFFAVCARHGVQPAHACVQYGLNAPGVTSIALNTSKAAKVKGNIELATKGIDHRFWQALADEQLI